MSEIAPEPAPAPVPVPTPSAARPSLDCTPAAPLFVWLVIQLIALAVAVFRAPLSARFPPPGEQFAIHIMLIVQVVVSAMLFPFLMRDVKTSVMVILTIVPFVQLSSYLSTIPIARAALAAGYVATWLVTLALWRAILQPRRGEMLGVACALALSLGGAVMWYLRAESHPPRPIDWSRDGMFGPILGAIAQLHADPSASWVAAGGLLVLSAVIGIAARYRKVGRSGNRHGNA